MKLQTSSILLDIGGTYIKTAALGKNQDSPTNIRKFKVPRFIENGSGRAIIPTSEFLDSIEEAIKFQLESNFLPEQIYVSGQMGGFVIENSEDFEIVSWQDQRTLDPQFEKDRVELESWLKNSLAFKNTGSELRPGLPFLSLAVTRPYSHKIDSQISFRSIISFVTSYLTDFQSDAMHVSDAAASGFFNLKKNAWDDDLRSKLDKSLIPPPVYNEVTKIGNSTKFGVAVFTGVGDQQASLLGTDLNEGRIVVNIGTGGPLAELKEDGKGEGKFQTRPYFGGKEIRTITHLPAGRSLEAFVDFCYPGDQKFNKYKEFERSCKAPDFSSQIDLVNFNETLKAFGKERKDMHPERVSSLFFGSLIRTYESALLHLSARGELLFAGGVGQKVSIISKELSRLTGRKFSISPAQETTLEGLAKIARFHS